MIKNKAEEDRIKRLRAFCGLDMPLKDLSTMKIDLATKKKLQREANKWLRYIKKHSNALHDSDDDLYHKGETNWIKLFFFSKPKKLKK